MADAHPADPKSAELSDLLYRQVPAFANVLRALGIKKGDRVAKLKANYEEREA